MIWKTGALSRRQEVFKHYIFRNTFSSKMKSQLKLAEKEIFINAPWGKVAALCWGDQHNPPVLLCHGKMDVASGFRPLVSLLPTCFFYVSVDLPGNGHSDQFSVGGRFTVVDFVPTLERVQQHFKWPKFMYIGHSLGVIIGKYFDLVYPGVITRMVELDPVPAFETWPVESFANWYHLFYGEYYSQEKYAKSNGSKETAPKYTYEKALDLMMNVRGLTREGSDHVLERCLEPAGEGLYRFTYDQRLKEIPRLPFPPEHYKSLYFSTKTPLYTFLAESLYKMGAYHFAPFLTDTDAWPNKNYRFKIVEGGHDVHIDYPERLAEDISKFLMEHLKSKI